MSRRLPRRWPGPPTIHVARFPGEAEDRIGEMARTVVAYFDGK